jgi:hypothetical protein
MPHIIYPTSQGEGEIFMQAENKTQAPYTISYNGKTYIHIPETTNFYNANNPQEKPLGLYTLLKKLSPQTYRAMKLKYTLPQELTLIGAASRMRVVRAVQLHYITPPITDYITEIITPALQYLTDTAENARKIQTQYNAARWAVRCLCGENIEGCEIDNLAAALFNYCGIAPDYEKHKMQGTSIHRITPASEGITIEIGNPHTLQARFNAGISEIDTLINCDISNQKATNPALYQKAAMRIFYTYKNWFLSVSEKYHVAVRAAYWNYIAEKLDVLQTAQRPEIPEIIEPENILPPQKIYLPYADFIKTEISPAQLKQRQTNAYNALHKASLRKAKRLPLDKNCFTAKQLKEVGLEGTSRKSAKEWGILTKVGKNFEFSPAFWEEVQQ